MLKIYEKSEEIHFMESSISALINSYEFKNVNLFLHKYVRNYDHFGHTKSKPPLAPLKVVEECSI